MNRGYLRELELVQTSMLHKRSPALLHSLHAIAADPGQRIIALYSSALVLIEIFRPELCPSKDNTRDSSSLDMHVMEPCRLARFTLACMLALSTSPHTYSEAIVGGLVDDLQSGRKRPVCLTLRLGSRAESPAFPLRSALCRKSHITTTNPPINRPFATPPPAFLNTQSAALYIGVKPFRQ
jgi:hypothetical protein